jgi:hypothetical protein
MARIGDTVRPELGRTDYSGYLQGAQQGAADMGRGIAQLGAGVGDYFKKQGEAKKEVTGVGTMMDAAAKLYGEKSQIGQTAGAMAAFFKDENIPLKERLGAAQQATPMLNMLMHKSETDFGQYVASRQLVQGDKRIGQGDRGLNIEEGDAKSRADMLRQNNDDFDAAREGKIKAMEDLGVGDAGPLPMGGNAASGALLPPKSTVGMSPAGKKAYLETMMAHQQAPDDTSFAVGSGAALEQTMAFANNPEMFRQSVIETTKQFSKNPKAMAGYVKGLVDSKNLIPEGAEGMTDKDRMEFATTLRKEFNGLNEVKDYKDVAIAYDKVEASAKSKTAAGDMALIFGFMKMLDPGSTVREGEYASAQDSTNLPGKVVNIYNKVVAGERLNEDQRKEFLGEARKAAKAHEKNIKSTVNQYGGLADKFKIERGEVMPTELLNFSVKEGDTESLTPSTGTSSGDLMKELYGE